MSNLPIESRALFDDEGISRQVIDPRLQRALDGATHIIIRFARRGVNEVEVDMLETRLEGLSRGIQGPSWCVATIQDPQHVRRNRLHAKGNTGETMSTDRREEFRGCGLRVRLRGHLSTRGNLHGMANGGEDLGQPFPSQYRRRPSADEDRGNTVVG